MGEFSSRVDAQRQILKVVNSRDWHGGAALCLNHRRDSTMGIDQLPQNIRYYCEAFALCFRSSVCDGNYNSDDPIAGIYALFLT